VLSSLIRQSYSYLKMDSGNCAAKIIAENPKTLVVFGNTGEGKSTVLNLLCGVENAFVESQSIDSVTQKTEAKLFQWVDTTDNINFIDTQGLSDTSGNDSSHIKQMVEELGRNAHINLFVVVINGTNPRLTLYTQETIKMFINIFGRGVLDNTVLLFSHWNIRERSPANEQDLERDYNDKFRNLWGLGMDKHIPCYFIDSKYNRKNYKGKFNYDEDEMEAYRVRIQNLYATLCSKVKPIDVKNLQVPKAEDSSIATAASGLSLSDVLQGVLLLKDVYTSVAPLAKEYFGSSPKETVEEFSYKINSFPCSCTLRLYNETDQDISNFLYRFAHIDSNIPGKIFVGIITLGLSTGANCEDISDIQNIKRDTRKHAVQDFKIDHLEKGKDYTFNSKIKFAGGTNHYSYATYNLGSKKMKIKGNWVVGLYADDNKQTMHLTISTGEVKIQSPSGTAVETPYFT